MATNIKKISKNVFAYLSNFFDYEETFQLLNTNRRIRTLIKENHIVFILFCEGVKYSDISIKDEIDFLRDNSKLLLKLESELKIISEIRNLFVNQQQLDYVIKHILLNKTKSEKLEIREVNINDRTVNFINFIILSVSHSNFIPFNTSMLLDLAICLSDVSVKQIKGLSSAIKKNKSLKRLNLSGNLMSDEAVGELAEALKINQNISEVKLNRCRITKIGGVTLAEMLKVNKSITELYMNSNNILDEGAVAFADALYINNSLKCVSLGLNKITDKGFIELVESLIINESLEKLYLEFNNISEVGAKVLLKALDDDNINLLKLDLEYNDLTDEANKEISKKLKSKIKAK